MTARKLVLAVGREADDQRLILTAGVMSWPQHSWMTSAVWHAQGPYQVVACRLLRRLWTSADLYDKLNT